MTHTSPMRARMLAGVALATGLMLAGCGGSADPSAPTAVDHRTCDQIRQVPAPANAATTAVVADPTASGTSGGFTPAAVAVLDRARDEGGVVDLVAVDGAGARPRTVVRGLPLDPAPGVDSVQADRARAAVVPCIEEWMRGSDAAPTAPGSDVVAAVDEAARHRPARLLVVSDGVATAGRLDLNRIGLDADPDEVAEQLAADGLSDGLRGLEVTWTGMGETAVALPTSAAENLERMWTASLVRAGVPADRLLVDHTGTPPRRLLPGTALPPDPVTVPEVATIVVGAGTTITVPDALLFAPAVRSWRPTRTPSCAPWPNSSPTAPSGSRGTARTSATPRTSATSRSAGPTQWPPGWPRSGWTPPGCRRQGRAALNPRCPSGATASTTWRRRRPTAGWSSRSRREDLARNRPPMNTEEDCRMAQWQRRTFSAPGLTQFPPGPHIRAVARRSARTVRVTRRPGGRRSAPTPSGPART